ncbi:hypothetical protein A4X09_0g7779 [Tilletia walkeri]|uniref:Uncharacterized protein n=1 Tax=Tilletia walkeri TaxID=117179 RepID=A0A8X7T1R4_9BASI|nr:hypothetical protein A4X09_0g7779 [Tilletia walkeri]
MTETCMRWRSSYRPGWWALGSSKLSTAKISGKGVPFEVREIYEYISWAGKSDEVSLIRERPAEDAYEQGYPEIGTDLSTWTLAVLSRQTPDRQNEARPAGTIGGSNESAERDQAASAAKLEALHRQDSPSVRASRTPESPLALDGRRPNSW